MRGKDKAKKERPSEMRHRGRIGAWRRWHPGEDLPEDLRSTPAEAAPMEQAADAAAAAAEPPADAAPEAPAVVVADVVDPGPPEDPRPLLEAAMAAEPPAPPEPVQLVDPDPVSVKICVDAVGGIAERIPPDLEPLSEDEKFLWTGVVRHTMMRLGVVTLDLWAEWTVAILRTFGTRGFSFWRSVQAARKGDRPQKPAAASGNGKAAAGSGAWTADSLRGHLG